ncbi:MAG: hypothetical protein LW808_001980 [Verrucomicrobiota bacterium]|nr:MAG: hypothetical protein LW808_001980 [Verrucomicrobiota bacterium]
MPNNIAYHEAGYAQGQERPAYYGRPFLSKFQDVNVRRSPMLKGKRRLPSQLQDWQYDDFETEIKPQNIQPQVPEEMTVPEPDAIFQQELDLTPTQGQSYPISPVSNAPLAKKDRALNFSDPHQAVVWEVVAQLKDTVNRVDLSRGINPEYLNMLGKFAEKGMQNIESYLQSHQSKDSEGALQEASMYWTYYQQIRDTSKMLQWNCGQLNQILSSITPSGVFNNNRSNAGALIAAILRNLGCTTFAGKSFSVDQVRKAVLCAVLTPYTQVNNDGTAAIAHNLRRNNPIQILEWIAQLVQNGYMEAPERRTRIPLISEFFKRSVLEHLTGKKVSTRSTGTIEIFDVVSAFENAGPDQTCNALALAFETVLESLCWGGSEQSDFNKIFSNLGYTADTKHIPLSKICAYVKQMSGTQSLDYGALPVVLVSYLIIGLNQYLQNIRQLQATDPQWGSCDLDRVIAFWYPNDSEQPVLLNLNVPQYLQEELRNKIANPGAPLFTSRDVEKVFEHLDQQSAPIIIGELGPSIGGGNIVFHPNNQTKANPLDYAEVDDEILARIFGSPETWEHAVMSAVITTPGAMYQLGFSKRQAFSGVMNGSNVSGSYAIVPNFSGRQSGHLVPSDANNGGMLQKVRNGVAKTREGIKTARKKLKETVTMANKAWRGAQWAYNKAKSLGAIWKDPDMGIPEKLGKMALVLREQPNEDTNVQQNVDDGSFFSRAGGYLQRLQNFADGTVPNEGGDGTVVQEGNPWDWADNILGGVQAACDNFVGQRPSVSNTTPGYAFNPYSAPFHGNKPQQMLTWEGMKATGPTVEEIDNDIDSAQGMPHSIVQPIVEEPDDESVSTPGGSRNLVSYDYYNPNYIFPRTLGYAKDDTNTARDAKDAGIPDQDVNSEVISGRGSANKVWNAAKDKAQAFSKWWRGSSASVAE